MSRINDEQSRLDKMIAALEFRKEQESEVMNENFNHFKESLNFSQLLQLGLNKGIQNSNINPDVKSGIVTLGMGALMKVLSGNKPKSLTMNLLGFALKTGLASYLLSKIVSRFRK